MRVSTRTFPNVPIRLGMHTVKMTKAAYAKVPGYRKETYQGKPHLVQLDLIACSYVLAPVSFA